MYGLLCPSDRGESLRWENLNDFPEIIQVANVIIILGFVMLYKNEYHKILERQILLSGVSKKKTWRGFQSKIISQL